MRFRPCIDIHNGKVKQIVGSSLNDNDNSLVENFVSDMKSEDYASMYMEDDLKGGHIIFLNKSGTEYYEATKKAAFEALAKFPYGMQIGGGINLENAKEFLDAKASHVIVTSFVFKDGEINYKNLELLEKSIGKEHIVLDISCKKQEDKYLIVTDRWQKFTNVAVNEDTLESLMPYCDEFLVHAADVEGKVAGIEEDLVELLGKWGKKPITYAGGIAGFDDIDKLQKAGHGNLDFTIGSALDIFGGRIKYRDVINYIRKEEKR